ncbi:heavy-metal-associated domain-containing protein [Acaryochloris marina NIES-2412]|uniref:heavy-metal-associated domain-containing protein n=1 Tax=Acaryochloris marina TaxID=155978 RepID=UPI0040590A3A
MIQLTISDMACGACVERIEAAIAALDTQATIKTNLDNKQVQVTSQHSDAEIRQAIAAAGYTPT